MNPKLYQPWPNHFNPIINAGINVGSTNKVLRTVDILSRGARGTRCFIWKARSASSSISLLRSSRRSSPRPSLLEVTFYVISDIFTMSTWTCYFASLQVAYNKGYYSWCQKKPLYYKQSICTSNMVSLSKDYIAPPPGVPHKKKQENAT